MNTEEQPKDSQTEPKEPTALMERADILQREMEALEDLDEAIGRVACRMDWETFLDYARDAFEHYSGSGKNSPPSEGADAQA